MAASNSKISPRSARVLRSGLVSAAVLLGAAACMPFGGNSDDANSNESLTETPANAAACEATNATFAQIRDDLGNVPSMLPDDVDGAIATVTGIGDQLAEVRQEVSDDAELTARIDAVEAALAALGTAGTDALNADNPLSTIPAVTAAYGDTQSAVSDLTSYCNTPE